jgi:hypothetical protein
MSTLALSSIQVTADYPVKLGAAPHQVLAPAGQATEILNRPTTPFAFDLPVPCPGNQAFRINVTGRLTISNVDLSLWITAGARYRVKGGPDLVYPVMQSDPLSIGTIAGHTLNLAPGVFHLLHVPQSVLPFMFVESWSWFVVVEIENVFRGNLLVFSIIWSKYADI